MTSAYYRLGIAPAKSFGGWLLLPILGLLITPIRMAYDFMVLYEDSSYSPIVWNNLFNLGDNTFQDILYGSSIIISTIHNGWLFVFTFALFYFLFTKRSNFPKLICLLYISTFVILAMDGMVAYLIDNNEFPLNKDVRAAFISCAIWIPYFFKSKRVEQTFVNRKEESPTIPQE